MGLGTCKKAHYLCSESMGHLAHLHDAAGGQRAGYDDHADARHTQGGGPGMGSPGERAGDYAY